MRTRIHLPANPGVNFGARYILPALFVFGLVSDDCCLKCIVEADGNSAESITPRPFRISSGQAAAPLSS